MSIKQKLQQSIERQWYTKPTWLYALAPLSAVFLGLSQLRKKSQQAGAYTASCPVIVVGNIAVGGTGKTPVIIALAKALKKAGFIPGIVSRGYGAPITADNTVHLLPPNAQANTYGDEPVFIQQESRCPVWIARARVAAVKAAEQAGCNVILADDGLQHYKMGRSFELAVQDASRGVGNGWCLPVGPLRELPARLKTVNYILNNCISKTDVLTIDVLKTDNCKKDSHSPLNEQKNQRFSLKPVNWVNVKTGVLKPLSPLPWLSQTVLAPQALKARDLKEQGLGDHIFAVAGIGNPARFFDSLKKLNVLFTPLSFPDHHKFTAGDFADAKGLPVVMTAKDAIKCQHLAHDNWWYLKVEADLPQNLMPQLLEHCGGFYSAR